MRISYSGKGPYKARLIERKDVIWACEHDHESRKDALVCSEEMFWFKEENE